MPSSRHSATAAGFWTSIESGPPSTTQPSMRSEVMTPPVREADSSTRTETPRCCSSYAAARPEMPPPTIATSTAIMESAGAPGRRVDVLREHLHVLDRRRWKNSVTQIEDMTGPSTDAGQDVVGVLEHPGRWAKQQRGIEVALDAAPRADLRPRLVDRHTPVSPDDIATGVGEIAEDRGRSRPEMKGGDAGADRVEDAPRMRRRELEVVGGVESSHPRVEHLHRVDTRFDLGQ